MFTISPASSPAMAQWLARLSRVALRHPDTALRQLETLERSCHEAGDSAAALDALYARFYLLEHRGRALDLQAALSRARQDPATAGHPLQAARIAEALGRLAYQQGDYAQAGEHWSRAQSLAAQAQDLRVGVAAQIGLGQIHYAMGAWERGRQLLRETAARLGELDDSYLASKLALNLGVGHFECDQLEDAERQFSHGLAAARRGQHREFEAEAHWHLARAALARGRTDWAIADCRLALNIAAKLGHSWLEAAASRTWTEIALARGDEAGAIRSTRHGLELAQRIHSRPQQSQAHLQLARLLQRQGDAGAALPHLWQHLALQSEIERLSAPVASNPPTGGADGRQAAERLLQLSNQAPRIASLVDAAGALGELSQAAAQIMALDRVQCWWARGPAGELLDEAGRSLAAAPIYLALLGQQATPLALTELAAHPCQAELHELDTQARSRIELPLFVGATLRGVLWLTQSAQPRVWSPQDLLQASHLARLCERVLLNLALVR